MIIIFIINKDNWKKNYKMRRKRIYKNYKIYKLNNWKISGKIKLLIYSLENLFSRLIGNNFLKDRHS